MALAELEQPIVPNIAAEYVRRDQQAIDRWRSRQLVEEGPIEAGDLVCLSSEVAADEPHEVDPEPRSCPARSDVQARLVRRENGIDQERDATAGAR